MNIVGRLTENAQVQTLSNGKQVVNFSVAVNDNYRNKAGENVLLRTSAKKSCPFIKGS